jgi:hypothetical protein
MKLEQFLAPYFFFKTINFFYLFTLILRPNSRQVKQKNASKSAFFLQTAGHQDE